ncbi:4-hydroxyphenylacetate 3-monooxygenase, oxygenase component [Microbacterium sp. 5K110]|jgi:4-hydroxyphenylacetate 3-monooxygenase|uniref:4-hydroxyphenylacetate 3-monooxygenase, oxygenase component n=1 Tax=unclassified Microbacterium TaxID=2609290 RepID=UPI0010FCFA8D|nr:4-hydroxyphenylacetate 3-monooxygenase, oxygenase component [Microbacterium sp. 5K110]TLF27447.1 4-hydroxyphenylacetate 3-monooxygenase, oxygenase component [Microbacterium sp. 5K110]
MPARPGSDYLARLNARHLEVHVDGEVVTSRVAEHPAFAPVARAYARLADLSHDPAHREEVTFVGDGGEVEPVAHLVPRSADDLARRRRGMQVWAGESAGFLGRTGDYLSSALAAFAGSSAFFARAGDAYAARVAAYAERVRSEDLVLSHTLLPPQVNRAVPAVRQGDGALAARVVEERADGIVVRGARMLATSAPVADELLVLPSTVLRNAPEDAAYSFAFAIPTDAPGLRLHCRTPLHRGGPAFDEPLAARFDEMDAVAVFDDVFVPAERVFVLGRPDLCNALYTETGAGALMTHQVVTRTLVKTEFFLGLASSMAEAIGIQGFPHIQQQLAELITYVEIERAMLRAAEVDGEANEFGVFLPRWATLNAARNWYPTHVSPRLTEIIRTLGASGLMATPSAADFPLDAHGDLEQYLQSATLGARERTALFRLAADAAVSGFAGRQSLYEYFFFGDPVRMASALVGSYDFTDARARVRGILDRSE